MSLTDLIDTLGQNPKGATHAFMIALICLAVFVIIMVLTMPFERVAFVGIISAGMAIISLVTCILIAINTSMDRDQHSGDYNISRDKNYLYINSHTDYIESAKLKIIGQDDKYVYVQKDGKTYNIPQIQDKK